MFKTLVMILVLLASTPVFASEDAIGIVVASRGLNITSDGSELSQGSYVYQHDTIITSGRSFVVVQFTDGTKLTVRPDTEIILDAYSYNDGNPDKLNMNLVSGGLRIISGAIAKSNPENYTLETPVALMGVRGTEFSIMLCDVDFCAEE